MQVWDSTEGEQGGPAAPDARDEDPPADWKAQNEAMHVEIGRLHGLLEAAEQTIQSERDRKFQEIAQIRIQYEKMEQELRETKAALAEATGQADALIKERLLRQGMFPFAHQPPPGPEPSWRAYCAPGAQSVPTEENTATSEKVKSAAKDLAVLWDGSFGQQIRGPMDRYWH